MGLRARATALARNVLSKPAVPPDLSDVANDNAAMPAVDRYWNRHLVRAGEFSSDKDSEDYLRWRSAQYPLFAEFMELYADHTGQTILDYGCGPGNDVVGFLLWSNPVRVIGMDVSETALGLARHRAGLHRLDPARFELHQLSDATPTVPLQDASVDWLHCLGVLHHSTHPTELMSELARVMKPGAQGRLMLYNRESVWYHVYVAYVEMVLNEKYLGLTVDQAFTRSTDGPDCPVSDAWSQERALKLVSDAGLRGTYLGGYLSLDEIEWWGRHGAAARADSRLEDEHRRFASRVTLDARGYPTVDGSPAGIGGVYTLSKPG